jgi:hypothetical protein
LSHSVSPPILIYLPSPINLFCGQTQSKPHDVNDASLSSQLPSTTIITLNYRLEALPSPLAYPIAIHDTATAFNYITSTVITPGRPKPKICLYGSQIGGALATMLALTQPNDIHALAISEALVDWVGLDEYTAKQTATGIQKSKKAPIPQGEVQAAEHLISLRSKLFRTPSSYFDPFASPTLFLRAPGRDTPASHGEEINSDGADPLSPEAFGPDNDDLHSTLSTSQRQPPTPSSSSDPDPAHPKRRKVLRHWPSFASHPESVLLPHTRIYVRSASPAKSSALSGSDLAIHSILRAQGIELAELMRRACFFGRERGFAERRVGVMEVSGSGSGSGTLGLEEAATWLGETLDDDYREE